MNITIIGGGNLGSAIARGLLSSEKYKLTLTGKKMDKLEKLQLGEAVSLLTDNPTGCKNADIVILCVQPAQVRGITEEIKGHLKKDSVLISTAAGLRLDELSGMVSPEVTLIRAMPNTATSLKQSMTCLSSKNASEAELLGVVEIFKTVGDAMVIEDELMQAATVLGASGIAFFLRYIRAVTQGGIQMGFHPAEAQKIAVQTAIGAASLVSHEDNHPESEIDRVTTPRGCTIEGLNEMEHAGLSSAVIKGLMASYNKINNIR